MAGIRMDADANHGCHERIMFLCMYEHAVQAVIIEDAVVNTFRGGALLIDLLISICATGNIGVKPDIPIGPGLDDPPIFGIRAGVFTFGTMFFPIGVPHYSRTAGTTCSRSNTGPGCCPSPRPHQGRENGAGCPVRHSCCARWGRHGYVRRCRPQRQ